ncbi:hypothetical protein HKX69_06025 [Streptomyces argyrophyllae]|uniref:DUF7848 domain-containing protein n=1 Tax=Streptomyces argyrophylli TaxID=2726118 RepID=A0A6M4PJK5_9ACTN|nr:hypothetical protein [Streptomyces argyrophyllae]QJS09130.1 hypothetical protein HKX69_06025 [Streptomyces argyrophyllae]
MRAVLRFVDYTVVQDPAGERTWKARCVSGEEKDCGAESTVYGSDHAPTRWMAEHCKETGHERFQRIYEDYALVRKPEE